MEVQDGNNHYMLNFRSFIRYCFISAICFNASCATLNCTSSARFGVSDLEKTGDVRAALAICYRAQKDNAAAGGGNTRNCDSLQDEFIRWQRFEICQEIYSTEKKHCLCQVYKICKAD
jgi:hypothetical protein